MALNVTIAGVSVNIDDSSFDLEDRVDERTRCSFTLTDLTGTASYTKGQPVIVTDSILGERFTGYVDQPNATVMEPGPARNWSIACIDQTWLADKRTSQKSYKNQFAGTIAVDQVQRYGSADGLSAKASLRWDELLSEWQQGTLTGTVATTNATDGNPGDGDLELALAGSKVTVTGTGSGFALGNGLLFTGYASSGYSTAYTYRQIWSGSQVINTATDFLQYDVWIASTSPQMKAAIEVTCSDGTILGGTTQTDQQGILANPTSDLSGLANDTWYTRIIGFPAGMNGKTIVSVAVAFAGTSAGTYTAYFRNISYNHFSGGLQFYFFGPATTLATNVQVLNQGYTNVSLTQVSVEDKKVQTTHSGLSIGAAGIVQSSQMTWTQALPNGATGIRETSIDNGASWQAITSGSAVPNLLPGMVVTGRSVLYRDTFVVGTDPTSNIGFGGPTLIINPAFASTKSDLTQSYTTATDFTGGTLTNLKTVGAGSTQGITLNGFQRNWDDANASNQTLFGGSSPFQSIINKQISLQTATGADVRSRLDFAGNTWQNFTAEVDIQISGTTASGLVYRCVNWGNNNDSYAYSITATTNQLQLGRGTNSTGAGAFTLITSATISLTSGSWHRLKIVINGNSHQCYLDGVLLINATDSTWTAAGYLGLRLFNGSGSTQSALFDNFGVCSALSGTWQSSALNIAGPGTYGNSAVFWDIDGLPDSTTSITAQTSIDGGSTFQSVTNGGAISGLTAGGSLVGKTLILKLTLTASNAPVVPVLNGVSAWILGQYSSTGSRSTAPAGLDTMQRANVASGWGTATNGQTYTQSGTGTTNLTSNEAQIISTTGDVQMQLGSASIADTDESVRFSLSASAITAGMELHMSDSSHYYRLLVSTTAISIVRNIGAGNSTLVSSSVSLSTGTFYRMRFRAVASGSTVLTLYGRVWQDGTTEPTAWNVTITDSPYRPTALTTTPLRYYRLDDTNTTAVDIGSGAQNGTLHGGVTESQTGLLTGDPDTAMLFDGSTGYISAPTTGLAAGNLTIAAWISVSNFAENPADGVSRRIAHINLDNTNGWQLSTAGADNILAFIANDSTGQVQTVVQGFAPNAVYFVVGVWNSVSRTTTLYVNGVAQVNNATGSFSLTTTTGMFIGKRPDSLGFFSGVADEVTIWNSALSAATILNLYHAGIAAGGFALMANGTGTAQFDTYRVTAYPDPDLSLLAVGRAATTLVNWNANLPTGASLTVQTSLDSGVTWQNVSTPGGAISGISTQPAAVVDTFATNTSANYTQSNFGGGVTGSWTWDTANSRLVGSGGTNGTIIHNPALTAADNQVMADFDQCDGSGLIANYVDANDLYFVQIWDGSGTGTQNAVKLFKRSSGTNTQLGSTATISWTRGNYKRFILDVQAGLLTVSLDGVQLIQVTDGSPLGAGKAGLLLNTLVRCYNLRIQQYGQNVSALSLYTKVTLASTDPTVTPQILDLQAFVASTNIGIGKLIDKANYIRTYVSANLADLNQQCGTTWTYVRPDKSVVFQDRTATPAPWILDSANTTPLAGHPQFDVIPDNLELDRSGSLYRNRQILTGVIGSASYTETKVGDGSTRTWNVANALTAPPTSWTLNGQIVTFGIRGVDSGKQFYYQIGSTSLTQDTSGAILASTDALVIAYPGAFTTEVVRDNATPGTFANTVSQAEMAAIDHTTGIVENVLDVSSLNMTVAAAQTYGDQLLQRYGSPSGRTLKFSTLRPGLAPGQQLTAFVPDEQCSDVQFLVTAVKTTAESASNVPGGVLYQYDVEATESATLGSWVRILASGLSN